MEFLLLIAAPVIAVLALFLFGRKAKRRRSQTEWERLPSGAVYNTFQQLVESQNRHGSEVAQHRAQDDAQGESD
jgi:hypothetical protein